jgi:hypothetical protein
VLAPELARIMVDADLDVVDGLTSVAQT